MKEFQTDESFAQLFENSIQNEQIEGSVAKGTVIAIEKDMVIIDVPGIKSEGVIPLKEFTSSEDATDVIIGNEYDVFIERMEGRGGRSVLSRERACREDAWIKFEQMYEQDANVNGKIIGRVKGGFAVDLSGVIAFLPGSQIDIRPIKDISVLVEIEQPFKILKMDKEQGNVVVSRRAILEESRREARGELLANIEEGAILEGVVKNITDYGAFIDLGPIDGLLHITDISWSKISHPSEVLNIGESIKVVVIKYNSEIQRVSLGLKQLQTNPWENLESRYKVGEKFKGKITTIVDYGAFVQLEPNIEGLVYHTEISWDTKNSHHRKLVNAGDEVEVIVLDLDIVKHRISLSMKKCTANPWQTFVEQYPVGSKIKGAVQNIADFGVFILVGEEGGPQVEALVPAIELSFSGTQEEELKKYSKGDIIEGIVLTSDVERERITVSVKQLSGDASQKMASGYKKGQVVTCTVTSVASDNITVKLGESEIQIKRSDISKHKSEQRCEKFGAGDKIDAKITSIDANRGRVYLSIKALEIDAEKQAIKDYGSTDSGASLGDILGAALNHKMQSSDAPTESAKEEDAKTEVVALKKKAAPKKKATDDAATKTATKTKAPKATKKPAKAKTEVSAPDDKAPQTSDDAKSSDS